jgi:hypothetical protein
MLRAPPTHSIGYGLTQLAFADYTAARRLLWDGYLLQGLILASTAVEKYLKAVLVTQGRWGQRHLADTYPIFRNSGLDLVNVLNNEYIGHLIHSFSFRYLDDSDAGPESIVIEQLKVLAELDYTVAEIDRRLTVGPRAGEGTPFQQAAENKNPVVAAHNYLLNGWPKRAFVQRRALQYVLLVERGLILFDAMLERVALDDGRFVGGALARDPQDSQRFNVTHTSPEPPPTETFRKPEPSWGE